MLLPVATIVVLSLAPGVTHLAAPDAHGAACGARRHGAAAHRCERAGARLRHGHGVAGDHVSLSRSRRHRPAAGAAARRADLHRRLLLRGAARFLRPRAAPAPGAVRLAHGQGLLVSRRAQHGRRHHRPVGRALPLRLPDGARELRAAVGVRAGGGAHTGADVGRRVLARGAAAGAAGARRRAGAGADGDAQRPGRRAVSRRADAHAPASIRPGCSARASAAPRNSRWWRCCSWWPWWWPSGQRAGADSIITPPGAIARSRSRTSRAGAAMLPQVCARCPCLAGFVAPFGILLVQATAHVSDALQAGFWSAVRNSVGGFPRCRRCDRDARSRALPTRAGWHPMSSCALRCGARGSATRCRERCWRSDC